MHAGILFDGLGTGEYKEAKYEIGGRNGTATYIYVIINKVSSSQIAITFSYNYLEESLTGNTVYTSYAGDITLDWLKWKACTTLQGMLPWDVAPRIHWA